MGSRSYIGGLGLLVQGLDLVLVVLDCWYLRRARIGGLGLLV